MNPRFVNAGRFFLGAIFLIAGGMKIAHPADFFSDLLGFKTPLPEFFLRVVAIWLPWLEAIAGLALIADFWAETVRPLVASLCLIFGLMLGQAVVRGLDLNCGCFGSGAHGWFERPDIALVRAAILFAVSLSIAVLPPRGR